jgi:hypothetical protein
MAQSRQKIVDWGGLTLKINNIELGCTKPMAGTAPGSMLATDGKLFCKSGDVGTVTTATTTTVEESGFGLNHITKLTMTAFVIGQGADNASLGIGAKFYTFPAGDILVRSASIYGSCATTLSVTAQTPEIAIGTVVASGAIANTTTTMENIMDGGATVTGLGDGASVVPDLASGLFRKVSLSTVSPVIKVSGGLSHDVFLNMAVAWADVTAAANVTFTGNIILEWVKLS